MPPLPQPFSHQALHDWILQFQQSELADQRLEALQAISVQGSPEQVRDFASQALSDPDSTIRALAAKDLRRVRLDISCDAQQALVRLLDDPDPDVRFESARVLIQRKCVSSERLLPILIQFLDEIETHPLMIAAVLETLQPLDLDRATIEAQLLPRLLKFLNHDRGEVREAVAISFARWPELCCTCAEQLLPLIDDSEPVVREKIAFAIGESGTNSESIRQALITATHDEDSEVARVATEAFKRLNS